jgi:hypothetical protein
MFEAECASCHADPRMMVPIQGPETIYSYPDMKAKLAQGTSSTDNAMYNTMRNVVSHTGGDRCNAGVDASPCKEVIAWWHLEYGADPATAASRGTITSVDALGEVYGYAFDPADGPKGTGTSVGTVVANSAGVDANVAGNHAFTFQLPDTLRDGKAHQLYGTVMISGSEEPLDDANTPTPFTSWGFTTAGRAYYTANIQSQLSQCSGCHTISYEQQYYSLIAPAPNQGGTATDNELINKPSETNTTTHGGGLKCATPNSSPCKEFQAWWAIEFGGG